jgi:hypothetical protein
VTYLKEAERAATANDAPAARLALNAATSYGVTKKGASSVRSIVEAAERRAAKTEAARERKERAEQAKVDAVERVAYGAILRNRFLDLGADVKVYVTGSQKDRITLQWIMFNDVWTHKMEKPDGIMSDIRKLHFKRVDMKDGYDYHVYWDLNNDD